MEKVKKEQLTGFRGPTGPERCGIQEYLLPELRRKQRAARRLAVFLGCAAGIFLISVLVKGMEGNYNAGEMAVMIALAFLTLWGSWAVNKSRTDRRLLLGKVRAGEFEVLDCISERFDTDVETVGKGVALIRDRDGHCCKDYFLIDYETARAFRGENHIDLLLMRQKEMNYYELFSEHMMGGR